MGSKVRELNNYVYIGRCLHFWLLRMDFGFQKIGKAAY